MAATTATAREVVEPAGENTEFVFFSGKGGVGKSTVSCATATWLGDNDYETLLVTTDPAPNLSDIFEQDICQALSSCTFSGYRASTNEYRSNQTKFVMFSRRCYASVAG